MGEGKRGTKRAASSSSADSEARRIEAAKRARRRAEHEERKKKRREQKEREKEEIKLAKLTPEERRLYEREKEQKALEEQAKKRRVKVERIQKIKAKVKAAEEKEMEEARKKFEAENQKWTLDTDDEGEDPPDHVEPAVPAQPVKVDEEDEVDPLDAFMDGIESELKSLPRIIGINDQLKKSIAWDEIRTMQWKEKQQREEKGITEVEEEPEDEETAKKMIEALKSIDADAPVDTETRDAEEERKLKEQDEKILAELEEKSKAKDRMQIDFDEVEFQERSYKKEEQEVYIKDLKQVDHSKIDYMPFRKNFYVEAREIREMTEEEVKERRKELDKLKVKGTNVPAPVSKWEHCGLSDGLLEALAANNYEVPFPIQAQGIPIIMSGRDFIGCARTGSGKTLAYILPMLRHIMDQPPSESDPIAFVLIPTRELAQQILKEINKFTPKCNVRAMAAVGGIPIGEQIADCRRGQQIIVGTPGRVIDLLVANKGRVITTYRTTFCVLDEADRMFDMGFGPQVAKIVDNIRPDRQIVMFSATFPKQIEAAAKKFLKDPVEVIIGGRCTASTNVTQYVDCFETEEHKFLRLLQLLGEWMERGLILVFTETQNEVDKLWEDLYAHGYENHIIMLHGGMDQVDRDLALFDFKPEGKRILIATSVASRGIDVPDLELVVNYRCPSHFEDYIHRIGRTGRAGKKGVAHTFYMIGEDEKSATWLVRALETSHNKVPEELQIIANAFWEKRSKGLVPYWRPNGGYSGRGYKFDKKEAKKRKEEIKAQMKARGLIDADSDDEKNASDEDHIKVDVDLARPANVTAEGSGALMLHPMQIISKAKGYADALTQVIQRTEELAAEGKFTAEIEINDYPQKARWKVTNREHCAEIIEAFEATAMVKGVYCQRGNPPPGERKLYIQIDGKSEADVQGAKAAIQQVLDEETQKVVASSSSLGVGRAVHRDGKPMAIGRRK